MKQTLIEKLTRALHSLNYPEVKVLVQPPKNPEFGDLSSNLAMLLAPKLKMPPIQIATSIAAFLRENDEDDFIKAVEAVPPGFLNFTVNKNFYTRHLKTILKQARSYGRSAIGKGKKALVEFVSANPTGPLTVGHGRGAILGDTVCNMLKWNGYSIQREYYFNNAGRQMRMLGISVYERYRELLGEKINFPSDGYQGDYIQEIAEKIHAEYGDSLRESPDSPVFRKTAEASIFSNIENSLARLGLRFDSFFNEQQLYDNKAIFDLLDILRDKGLIYEKEGATWFRATAVGREADKVLIKSTGEPTYRLPDMAYHISKFERGFDLIIDVFGADHVDTFPDILAVVKSLGYPQEKMKVLIHQFVTILKDGEQVKMSTRKANFITLDQLTDEVGADVVRYFFIMRGMSTHLNFDLDLARDQSDENPVFYLQYAHARVCNIIKRAEAAGLQVDAESDLSLLQSDIELKLIQRLLEFPEVILMLHDSMEPQQLANYLQTLATVFHKFYATERVITDQLRLTAARLVLTEATRIVLSNGLEILGITAPARM